MRVVAHSVGFVKNIEVVQRGVKVKIVPRLGRNLTIVVYSARLCSKTDRNIAIMISVR